MSEQLFDYFDDILRQYFGTEPGTRPRIRRADFDTYLTDDVRLHVLQGREAALQWSHRDASGPVDITARHVVVTEHGLLYAAELQVPVRSDTPPATTWQHRYYLATPHAVFDQIVDRVHDAPPPRESVAAVDCRLDRDLTSMWQFEGALRRLLDDYPVLELELSGAQ
jgi:hypothetical protein